MFALRDLALRPVETAMFDEDDRVIVADGGFEHALGVARIGRHDDFEPGDVGEPRFEALRVVRAHGAADAALHTDGQRDLKLPA